MNTTPAGNAAAQHTAHFDSLTQRVYLNLWRAYDRLKALEDEAFTPAGLSAQQYNALRLLRAAHPERLPVLTIGRRLVSRAPDMTRLIDRLELLGLVLRERRVENRRVVEVGITDAGLTLLRQLDEVVRDLHQRQLGHLSDEELLLLADLLERVRAPHEPVGGSWCLRGAPSEEQ